MSKKAGSIAVICILTILLIISVAIFFSTQNSLDNLQNVDPSNDQLPGASFFAMLLGSIATWIAFIFGEFIVSLIGFLGSCIAIKIAPKGVLKGISIGFFVFYSLLAIVTTTAIVFVVVAVV